MAGKEAARGKEEVVVDLALPPPPPPAPPAQLESVPYRRLFCFADSLDVSLMVLGTVGALAAGVLVPLTTQAFAGFIGAFAEPDPAAAIRMVALQYLGYAAAGLVAFSLQTGCWALAGQRQSEKWRAHFLAAALRQDVAFYDVASSGGSSAGLSQALAEDTATLQAGISEKVGLAISEATMFVTGFVIAFTRSWSMTLVLLGSVPLIAAAAALLSRAVASSAARTSSAYAAAASIAAQAIANVRTLAAAGAERRAVEAYAEALEEPRRVGERQGVFSGLAFGWFQLAIHAGAYASALYFAATQVAAGRLTGGEAVGVMFASLIGAMALGQLAPNLQHPARARVAAASLLRVIERRPEIEVAAQEEPALQRQQQQQQQQQQHNADKNKNQAAAARIRPSSVRGEIVFRDVVFSYPTTPDRRALDGFSLVVPAGQTIALVGQSGSGKSTTVQLLQRFYDVSSGGISLDGMDLRSLDLKWLRSVTSLVSQEPTLFATTIYENIAIGLAAAAAVAAGGVCGDGDDGDMHERVIAAAKAANAHAFIMRLPHGYLTQVGEKGLALSGGQRQRIAIARAVLRQPRLLLLDEATAALDSASERKVQAALDAASRGRTTLTIAHRLSTVKNAERIVVVREGRVVEQGAHAELAAREGGAYAALLSLHAAADAAAEEQLRQQQPQQRQGRKGLLKPSASAASRLGAADNDEEGTDAAAAAAAAAAERASTAAEAAALRRQLEAAKAAQEDEGAAAPANPGASGRLRSFAASFSAAAARRNNKSAAAAKLAEEEGPSAVSFSAPTALPEPALDPHTQMLVERRRREEEAAASPPTPGRLAAFRRLARLNAPEAGYGVLGAVGSLCAGAIQPAFALAFSALIASYYLPDTRQMLRDASLYALIFVAIGFGGFLALLVQQACFGVMGQRLAARVRVLLLASILRQEAAWFELPSSSTGELSARLSADASAIRGACADVVGVALQESGTILFGYVAALFYDWRMALVVTAALPVITAAFALQTKFRLEAGGAGGGGGKDDGEGGGGSGGGAPKGKSRASKAAKAIGRSNALAADAFASIRVVHAYGLEQFVCGQYRDAYAPAAASARRAALAMGASWGLAQAIQWLTFAAIILFGGDEVLSGRATYDAMLKSFMCVFFVAIGLSEAMNGFSNVGAAIPAAARVFAVIDRRSAIDPFAAGGGEGGEAAVPSSPLEERRRHQRLEREAVAMLRWSRRAGGKRKAAPASSSSPAVAVDIDGAPATALAAAPASAELRDVVFRYPSRPQSLIFDGLSLSIPAGATQALVGESGSGKSTVVQLLLRLYDPEGGSVCIDGVDVREWPSVAALRQQMALVSQEPVLFNDTVLGNVRLARPDAPMSEVVAAVRAAHAEEFIAALPHGYDTRLGEGGVQLSGGQRQRLAIARALLKKPRLLLLDEATSALDNASEKKVQEALDEAAAGRTTILVAHRLASVRAATNIAVIHRGRVLEQGTHEQLLALGPEGAYAKLVQAALGGGGGGGGGGGVEGRD